MLMIDISRKTYIVPGKHDFVQRNTEDRKCTLVV